MVFHPPVAIVAKAGDAGKYKVRAARMEHDPPWIHVRGLYRNGLVPLRQYAVLV